MGEVIGMEKARAAAEKLRWATGISDALQNLTDDEVEALAGADVQTLANVFSDEIAHEATVRRARQQRVEDADQREADREEEIVLRDSDMLYDR